MSETATTVASRKASYWVGWVLSSLAIVFLLLDAAVKLLALPAATETGAELGFAGVGMARGLGTILLVCTLLYIVPRTTVLGAILLTAYLGGAVATQLRVDAPLLTHTLFPVYLGVLVWAGLWLRDPRIRALTPLRTVA